MGKVKVLTGLRFGRLTVLRQAERTVRGYARWVCRCDCGNEIVADSRRLTRGTVTDCGCRTPKNGRNGSRAEDLTGRVFGRLTVIKRVENRKGRVCWLCRCTCGNEKVCAAQLLKSGNVKSCGCLYGLEAGRYRDITNVRFGRLIAIEPTEERDYKGSLIWRCRCDCGSFCVVSEDDLASGNTKSCGCRKEEIKKVIGQRKCLYDGTSYTLLRCRTGVRSDSQSGHRGICVIGRGTYKAHICFKGKRYYLGTYRNLQDALSVRRDAEILLHEGFCDAYDRWKALSHGWPSWEEEHPLIYEVSVQNRKFSVRCNIEELEQRCFAGQTAGRKNKKGHSKKKTDT